MVAFKSLCLGGAFGIELKLSSVSFSSLYAFDVDGLNFVAFIFLSLGHKSLALWLWIVFNLTCADVRGLSLVSLSKKLSRMKRNARK